MKTIQLVPQYETGASINDQVRKCLEVKSEIRQYIAHQERKGV
jgi:hypothetical protein